MKIINNLSVDLQDTIELGDIVRPWTELMLSYLDKAKTFADYDSRRRQLHLAISYLSTHQSIQPLTRH